MPLQVPIFGPCSSVPRSSSHQPRCSRSPAVGVRVAARGQSTMAGGRSSTGIRRRLRPEQGAKTSRAASPSFARRSRLPPCIIDAEIVGCDAKGVPDFHGLMAGSAHGCCAWCFDLMTVGGKDVRPSRWRSAARDLRVCSGRRPRPAALLGGVRRPREANRGSARTRLEGIVSKGANSPTARAPTPAGSR